MDSNENYEVKDLSLAEQGKKNIDVAELRMGSLIEVKKRFEKELPFKNITIGMALHVTKETAVLIRTLITGGAKVAITGCNPLSTQDDVAAALAKEGVNVFAYRGETKEDYYRYLKKIISYKPDITIDDGCDLVAIIHKEHPELIPKIIGGCEETTTGVIRLKAMEKDNALKYPIIAVNNNKTKHLFDNYYGTGQSTLDGIMRATNILFAGKTLVVCGYGDCGKGVALKAKGFGSEIIVCEIEPVKALQARMDGYRVMPLMDASKIGDIFITVTGNKHVIRTEHIDHMKNGAVLANSGHFDLEIDVSSMNNKYQKRQIRNNLEEYTVSGKKIYLCAEGRLVNLGAAEGHPSEVMATSFCGQALACEYLVKNNGKLDKKVIDLPEKIDKEIATLQLKFLEIKIDFLTDEQKKYLESWEEGT
ncbi:MAG: adenosylhomocysteinase [Candidatus Micrarchaeia archaeon]